MSNKQTQAIAAIFASNLELARQNEDAAPAAAIRCCIDDFAELAQKENPRFDKPRFLKACGV